MAASHAGGLAILVAATVLAAPAPAGTGPTPPAAAGGAQLVNPASRNCELQGGRILIERRGDGGEIGICYFEDNRQCEEWALLGGLCPVGGLKVTGYATPAARYCAVTGGRYEATGDEGGDREQGTCTLADGQACDAWRYFDGTCAAADGDSATFTDPFAYCAAVGTVDGPDRRYTGEAVPDSVVRGLVATGIVSADAPPELARRAVWRCLDGQVVACHPGANLPCREKADVGVTPTVEMSEFCAANPAADSIPAAVTGRATVYAWGCQNGGPVPVGKPFSTDAAGFLAELWHRLPGPGPAADSERGPDDRIRISSDGRMASIPIDPDNVEATRDLIESGPARSGNVSLFIYEPVGLAPQLLASGEPEAIQRFVSVVKEMFLDTGAKHMVVISARLTQLSDSEIRGLGLNLFPSSLSYSGLLSLEVDEDPYGYIDIELNQSAGNILVADESLGRGKALVASEVFTPNGVKAEISDVQHEPIFSLDTYGNVQTEYQDLETTIEVLPMVMGFDPSSPAASRVRLDISVKVSIISGEKRMGDTTAPQYSDKSFQTTRVFPADGRTYLVGSFVSDSDITSRSGVPGLSKIPLLKYLFSQKTTTRSRSYALLTLAVHVLPATFSWDDVHDAWSHRKPAIATAAETPEPARKENADDLNQLLDEASERLQLDQWTKTP